jgi:drug/metabolite transporter (DMT)-like permease
LNFDFATVPSGGWLALAWYGAGTLALGSALWYGGVSRAEGSVAAGFMGLMPVSALVLSYLLLGEAFRWLHPAGFGVVFLGVLLMSWEHARHAHHAKER